MGFSIIYSWIAFFLPFVFGIYLLLSRVKLSLVPRNTLNYGLTAVNLITLILFLFLYCFVTSNYETEINLVSNFFTIEKFSFEFGIFLDKLNLKFLIYSNVIYLLISMYSIFYFAKKKQYIFTKQRFYIFLSFLIFNTFLFFSSPNMFQNFVFWILQGVLIFIFSYYDIFKTPTNFNITRFQRISVIGDFSYFLAILLLFKYTVLSKGYIHSPSLNFSELNELTSYMYGLADELEFKLLGFFVLLAILSKMFIFPLSCYYSFFANSSNIFYLTIVGCSNISLGAYLFIKVLPFLDFLNEYKLYFMGFIAFSVLFSFISVLFEKSFKIIFGHIYSILSSIFLILCLKFAIPQVLFYYFLISFVILVVLMFLFINDKVALKNRIINKQTGFVLERCHIFVFEKLPVFMYKIVDFIDKKIVQNFVEFIVLFLSYLVSLMNIKMVKTDVFKTSRNILILFAMFALFAIFIALFGRYR